MFNGCENIKVLDISIFDTRNVICIRSMLNGCSSLKEVKLPKDANTRENYKAVEV